MPASKTIDFIFDFASLNAYLAWRALPELVGRTGATVNVIPCLLGGIFKATGNQAPFSAFAGIRGKLDYEMLEIRRFVKAHGITAFQMNPHFPVNSLLAMRGLCACAPGEEFDRYLDAVLAGFWERGLQMGDAAVLAGVLDEAGLEAERLLSLAQTDAVKAKLADNTAAAVERGAFGAPTFWVGDEMFFGKERLGQIEDLLFA
ncbi:2-hydroxychromene-2-carboxylate isomerase [Brevundimonas goettingensis]|uniref:2-hydroxychromene-2-carboxylate isomerase n=1 Tax=Brevundimonas goettingensis TaxID=2774190 RepID=A0A975BYR8_9CAUL|nr:2-hydroxychromene-2-carboxylate isomerase [Brevundimonas goettingensis]QTC90148.1 2-hydroxychromene-2-carboxylate isomerase [Brevundimonas goettingensis]